MQYESSGCLRDKSHPRDHRDPRRLLEMQDQGCKIDNALSWECPSRFLQMPPYFLPDLEEAENAAAVYGY